MKILFHLVTILLAIGFAKAGCRRSYFVDLEPNVLLTEAQMYVQSVPEQDRPDFIRYFLAEAIRHENSRELLLRDLIVDSSDFGTPPADFASNLLQWTRNQFNLNDDEVVNLVEYGLVISSETNSIVSPQTIGCHCCPF